jgi:hypothetical protein
MGIYDSVPAFNANYHPFKTSAVATLEKSTSSPPQLQKFHANSQRAARFALIILRAATAKPNLFANVMFTDFAEMLSGEKRSLRNTLNITESVNRMCRSNRQRPLF